MKLWVWKQQSGDYRVSRRKPKMTTGYTCGLKNCATCPLETGYTTDCKKAATLCKEDFEPLLGKGFSKGLGQMEVTKL